MAKEWREQSAVPSSKIIEAFEDKGEVRNNLRLLFHTLHRKTLRSLLLGTLPHDLYDKDSPNWENIYSQNGPGTYLVGISIEDRRGAFLSRNEIEQVVDYLREYKAAWEAWLEIEIEESFSQDHLSHVQKSALNRALAIDNVMLPEKDKWRVGDDYTKPRCAKGKISNLDEFIAMLSRRVDAQFDGEAYQIACPTYVGCGHRVSSRLQHNPDYSSMSRSPNTLKLLISCIRYLGLKPIVHTIPMVMVWEEVQIPLAEMLVTVLAQSLITINGLNIIQPGISSTSSDEDENIYFENKKHVWLECPWLFDNIKETLAVRNNRDLYCNTLEILEKNFMSEAELREYAAKNDELRAKVEDLQTEVYRIIEKKRAEQEEVLQRLAEIDKVAEAAKGMFPDLSYDEEEDDDDDDEENDNDDGQSKAVVTRPLPVRRDVAKAAFDTNEETCRR
ncbi:hypothetical protein F5Y00DRAFT_254742 [Daldinia vernicosa]|uniref:uncharacterized protein n=1 Tax=Daldinia vernicosa TaxID=114800 RepID=UPI002008E8F2|nr:uncharacterized protein F5Y00DRAFT_254742 [Daldinia vernicosa]KAI0846194.1 hypothetical protein F5Y00DRAFT_254742 [Daldinia vernicosa]